MSPSAETEKRLAMLPKVDLHVHLDGSVMPETILELGRSQGISLPADSAEGLLPFMRAAEDCDSLQDYLSTFAFVLRFLQDEEALERVAFELVMQAAQERCLYMEVRFAPQLHTEKGLSLEAIIGHVIKGLKRGEEAYGVTARVIVICMRHHDLITNKAVAEAAAEWHGRGVAAIDLAGDEAGYPAHLFHELFSLAKQRRLPVTIHAGEAAGPANIYESVVHLGASRIGHGVRVREDREVLELLKARQIPLEMCPVSNIQTKAIPEWALYPLPEYLNEGLLVTVNTDNRTVSGTTLLHEYRMLMVHCGVTENQIADIILNGLRAAFVEEDVKERLVQQFNTARSELGFM